MTKAEKIELSLIANEAYAALCFIMEFGKLELGTVQSRRFLEKIVRPLSDKLGKPVIPADYPMVRNQDE